MAGTSARAESTWVRPEAAIRQGENRRVGQQFQTPVRIRHRLAAIGLVGFMFVGLVMATAPAATAAVEGPCTGSVTILGVGYGPDNDTRDNPILVPKEDGATADWEGATTEENTEFQGDFAVRIGPTWIQAVTWQAANPDDTRSGSGTYNLDDAWDEIPDRSLLNGIYEGRARHSTDGFSCTAIVFLKFDGSPLSSPVVLVLIAIGLLSLAGLWFAGLPVKDGFFQGRPVFGAIVGLLAGVVAALLLQQFSIWPLDNLTTIGGPVIGILLGLVLAKVAPFGRTPA